MRVASALYDRPANDFVARFIGSPAMNLVTVPIGATASFARGEPVPLAPAVRGQLDEHLGRRRCQAGVD